MINVPYFIITVHRVDVPIVIVFVNNVALGDIKILMKIVLSNSSWYIPTEFYITDILWNHHFKNHIKFLFIN